ncbi:MAG: bifunctional diguanylate cyclase/phosphodiesterase [Candidatus Thiodiazotropha lotti]|nr:bifunctional diguanylate cyclase/phosphodiesterase [Candidatus Thiodiazotropha lotti]MCW4196599.1 bifunctional diguanylate cyclase/phosphodiesterase [Candidatus Thiodiazotropha lotti]
MSVYTWDKHFSSIKSDLNHAHALTKSYLLEKIVKMSEIFQLLDKSYNNRNQDQINLIFSTFIDTIDFDRNAGTNFFQGHLTFDREFLDKQKPEQVFLKNSFYYTTQKQWVTPICYRFSEGDVGCFAIDLEDLTTLLTRGARTTGINHVISTSDYWLIHNSFFDKDQFASLYSANMMKGPIAKTLASHSKSLKEEIGLSLDEFLAGENSHSYQQRVLNGEHTLIMLSSVPTYNLFIASGYTYSEIWRQFLSYIYGIVLLTIGFNTVLFFLFKRYDKLNEKHRLDLEYKNKHDSLTGLLTRRASEQVFMEEHPISGTYVLAEISINKFHLINERFGHHTGDLLLQYISNYLKNYCTNPCYLIRDIGPDFFIISPDSESDKIEPAIEQLLEEVKKPIAIGDVKLRLNIKAGIFKGNLSSISYREALKCVDLALWKAKKEQINLYTYTEETHEQVIQRSRIRELLDDGIAKHEFHLVYQPQIEPNTGVLTGIEALARWNSTKLGFIPPLQFIDIAEESGLILDLGRELTTIAINDFKDILAKTNKELTLSINFSIYQFLSDTFLNDIDEIIGNSGIPPKLLTLEITESIFVEELAYIKNILLQLHERGFHISLDDFGTGYSSLSMLSKLPIDEIKIDKSFIDNIQHSRPDYLLVRNILAIGKTLDLKVVAEGIEHTDQADILQRHHCHSIQGYLYSKPLPKEEIIAFINKNKIQEYKKYKIKYK